jgi:rhodanese-related sulfurtransferase
VDDVWRCDVMNLIGTDELRERLAQGDPIKLVMTLGEWAYRAKHIPDSLHFASPDEAFAVLQQEDEIVVYCSHPGCVASQAAYHLLERRGYQRVRRYAGGLEEWEAAGYPLVGEMVERPDPVG